MTALDPVLEAVLGAAFPRSEGAAEICHKRGRSRRLERDLHGRRASFHQEEGWAVRAGDDRGSLFTCATGAPSPEGPWPEADGEALALPEPVTLPEPGSWKAPRDLDAPLVGEREGFGLLQAVADTLVEELPGARLVSATLDDGFAVTRLRSTRGIDTESRSRVALLRLEALYDGTSGGDGPQRSSVAAFEAAAREARRFEPRPLARRLVDRLVVSSRGEAPERERGAVLLAPPVAAQLLAGLAAHLLTPDRLTGPHRGDPFERAGRLEDRRGRFASPALTLVDDGRLPDGVLTAATDGEGLPTRAVTLVEGGAFRQPLLTWSQASAVRGLRSRVRPSGCRRRPGWRDLPHTGPSHLYAVPDPDQSAGDLLAEIPRGFYLLDTPAQGPAARFLDLEADRFALPVTGFAVERGRAQKPVAGAWLTGSVGSLLRGIEAVARDLGFYPLAGGMVGSPTLLVTGVEVRSRPS